MGLRVRKKKNQSGSISVQIVDGTNRGYKVVETLGCSDVMKLKLTNYIKKQF